MTVRFVAAARFDGPWRQQAKGRDVDRDTVPNQTRVVTGLQGQC
jgi:hypothetical protein